MSINVKCRLYYIVQRNIIHAICKTATKCFKKLITPEKMHSVPSTYQSIHIVIGVLPYRTNDVAKEDKQDVALKTTSDPEKPEEVTPQPAS